MDTIPLATTGEDDNQDFEEVDETMKTNYFINEYIYKRKLLLMKK